MASKLHVSSLAIIRPLTPLSMERTTVWLKKNTERMHIFYCPTCRFPIFKYQGTVLMMVPGNANDDENEAGQIVNAPFEFKCGGYSQKYGKCPALYLVEGFTS